MNEELRGSASENPELPSRKYLWPKLLLAALLMGGVISFLFVSKEVHRMRTIRDAVYAATNSPANTNQ